jgi:hypothetical protein
VHHVQERLGPADLKQTSATLNVTLVGLKGSTRKSDDVGDRSNSVASEGVPEPPLPRNNGATSDAMSLNLD